MAFGFCAGVSIFAVIFAHFWYCHWNDFYLSITFIIFRMLSSISILVVWGFRLIRQRRIWWTCIWIRVSWYIHYRIGWVVAWIRIALSFHTLCWWFMQWLWRVTCTISNFLWRSYQRVQIQLMYRIGCMVCIYWRHVSQWCYHIKCTIFWVYWIPFSL